MLRGLASLPPSLLVFVLTLTLIPVVLVEVLPTFASSDLLTILYPSFKLAAPVPDAGVTLLLKVLLNRDCPAFPNLNE